MKYLLPIFLLVAISPIKSQSVWLKGYLGIVRDQRLDLARNIDPDYIFVNEQSSSSLLAMPAIAFAGRERDFWELGFSWTSPKSQTASGFVKVPPTDSVQFVYYGRTKFKSFDGYVEFNYCFTRKKEDRWQTFIGLAFNPYWSSFYFNSSESYIYSTENKIGGANFGFVPRVQYKWKNNLSFDINLSINAVSGQYHQSARRNPILTKTQQESQVFEVDFLGGYMLRAGLAWKIWQKKETPTKI